MDLNPDFETSLSSPVLAMGSQPTDLMDLDPPTMSPQALQPLTPPPSCTAQRTCPPPAIDSGLHLQHIHQHHQNSPHPISHTTPVGASSTPLVFARRPRRRIDQEEPSASTPIPRQSPTSHDAARVAVQSLASSSPQQEPGSGQYLARLLRLVRSNRPCAQGLDPMSDFLASFNFGAQTPAPTNGLSCGSVQELLAQLGGIIESKVTPSRAEHVSTTLELRSTTQFTLMLSEPENGALENSSNIDPSLGGPGPTPLPTDQNDQNGGPLSRVVDANDALMNQPQDDPALQRSVAKHIINAISTVDHSAWVVREMSRGAPGWTFTYLCKDSYQQWSRQNSKAASKAVVGEYSLGELDPTLSSRPAFDCQGLVVIAFNRSSRSISVKYNHTPLHKSVAQLAQYFKPPPRELGPGAQRALQQKTPKGQKTPKKSRSEKKAAETGRAQDENGNPRKRKKKNNGAAQVAVPGEPVMPPDYPNAAPLVDGLAQHTTPRDVSQPSASNGENPSTFNDYPQGLVGGGDASAFGASHQPASQALGASFPIIVSTAEAARRKELATSLLSNANVDPNSLSADQFSIFSNQSPELQKESLSMLVKYGAERLRIVHPSNREGSASTTASASVTPAQTSQPTPSGPITTKELVPQSQDAVVENGTSSNPAAAEEPPQTSTKAKAKRGMGKSKTACFSCKSRKVKCPRERPICAECQTQGLACEYAPRKPNKPKSKSDAFVVEEADEDQDVDVTAALEETQMAQSEPPEAEDYQSYGQIPGPEMFGPTTAEHPVQEPPVPQPTYFQSGSGLALPQAEVTTSAPRQPVHRADELLPQQQSYGGSAAQPTQPMDHSQPASQPSAVSPIQGKRTPRGSAAKSRQSFPSEPARSQDYSASMNTQPGPGWGSITATTAPTATMAPVAPSTTNVPRTRHSASGSSVDESQASRGMQQAATLAQAGLHQPTSQMNNASMAPNTIQAHQHQSPVLDAAAQSSHRRSPMQPSEASRAATRQNQRAQPRTSAVDQTRARGYAPPSDVRQEQPYTTSSHMGGMSRYNDNNRVSGATTTTMTTTTSKSYEAYSHQHTTSAPASSAFREAQSRNTDVARPMTTQAPSTMAPSYAPNTTATHQWSGSQSHNTRSYSNSTTFNTQSAYNQPPTTTTAPSASLQSFNMRGSQSQPSRADSSLNEQQQQQQGYPSYPSQNTQQQNQAANQQSSWYNFNNSGSTSGFTPANQPGYGWKMSDDHWSSV